MQLLDSRLRRYIRQGSAGQARGKVGKVPRYLNRARLAARRRKAHTPEVITRGRRF